MHPCAFLPLARECRRCRLSLRDPGWGRAPLPAVFPSCTSAKKSPVECLPLRHSTRYLHRRCCTRRREGDCQQLSGFRVLRAFVRDSGVVMRFSWAQKSGFACPGSVCLHIVQYVAPTESLYLIVAHSWLWRPRSSSSRRPSPAWIP